MQPIDIDFDALDASYIPGTEFVFWGSLKWMDPHQPHLTTEEVSDLVQGDCGANWPLEDIFETIDGYWAADDD